MATVNSIASLSILEFGGSTTVTAHVTKVEAYVNDAYKDLCREYNWAWLRSSEVIATIASTAEYSLATTGMEAYAARLAGSVDKKLYYTPVQWLMDQNLELTGQPERFWNSGFDSTTGKSKIKLYPVPDAVYSLEVYEILRPANLATSATIPIPEEFIPLLKHKVRYFLATDDKDYKAADRWMALYRSEVDGTFEKHGHPPAQDHEMAQSDIPRSSSMLPRLPGNYPRF